MRIGVIGINHKSASLDLREKVARAGKKAFVGLPVVVLATCNRTEVYFSGDDLAEMHSEILGSFQRELEEPFEHALYAYFGRECFLHLASVTSGLDSALLGESDIQRQVKVSYQSAPRSLSSSLHYLFQKCLKLGKEMRTHFQIFRKCVSLEGIVCELGRQFFHAPAKVLFVGNSEVNRKVIRLFSQKREHEVHLATRTPHAAEPFALDHGVHLSDWSALFSWHLFDWVVCGTESPRHLIEGRGRDVQTRLIIDLALPRNVDPAVGRSPHTTLLNIEQIGELVEKKRRVVESDIAIVRHALEEGVDRSLQIHSRKREMACALSL